MTRFLLTLALLLPTLAHAQQGRVEYTVVTEIDMDLPPELEAMRDQIPTESTAQRVLLFDGDRSLTRSVPTADAVPDPAMDPGGSGVSVIVMDGSGDSATFVDRADGTVVETRDLFGRAFRIVDTAKTLAWRLTGEQSEFLGYTCQRATAKRGDQTVEAWFTTEIPASVGPESYGGLPGLILVLRDGPRSFEATAVDLSALADGVVVAPTGGREVTREAFATILDERMRDMETSGLPGQPGSGRFIRR